MTLKELTEILEDTKYPVAYEFFPDQVQVSVPFLTYRIAYSNNFGADDVMYSPINHVIVELYTAGKDLDAQQTVETALNFTYWTKDEDYLDDEKILLTTYEFEIQGGNE